MAYSRLSNTYKPPIILCSRTQVTLKSFIHSTTFYAQPLGYAYQKLQRIAAESEAKICYYNYDSTISPHLAQYNKTCNPFPILRALYNEVPP